MKHLLLYLSITALLFSEWCYSKSPPASEILWRVDKNFLTRSSVAFVQMEVYFPNDVIRTKQFKLYTKDRDKSYIEFLEPARDAGTKLLMLEKSMWLYFPRPKKSLLIKNNMLQQSIMGSDFSYEDIAELRSLLEDYNARVIGTELIDEKNTYVLELVARDQSIISYPKRKIWIDRRTYIPIRSEYYTQSGKLLKTLIMRDIKRLDNRWYPTIWEMKDELRENTKTIINLINIDIDVYISNEIFTKRNLEN